MSIFLNYFLTIVTVIIFTGLLRYSEFVVSRFSAVTKSDGTSRGFQNTSLLINFLRHEKLNVSFPFVLYSIFLFSLYILIIDLVFISSFVNDDYVLSLIDFSRISFVYFLLFLIFLDKIFIFCTFCSDVTTFKSFMNTFNKTFLAELSFLFLFFFRDSYFLSFTLEDFLRNSLLFSRLDIFEVLLDIFWLLNVLLIILLKYDFFKSLPGRLLANNYVQGIIHKTTLLLQLFIWVFVFVLSVLSHKLIFYEIFNIGISSEYSFSLINYSYTLLKGFLTLFLTGLILSLGLKLSYRFVSRLALFFNIISLLVFVSSKIIK